MVNTLLELGHEVLAIDPDKDLVQSLSDDLPDAHLVAGDATDIDVLRDLNVGQFDGAAVTVGENIEASILATVNLKELGVPMVMTRAVSTLHIRVLERIGTDRILEPEREMGEQMARIIASPAIRDYVELGEDEALIEAEVPDKWVGKSLADLELSRKSGLAVVTLKPKDGAGMIPNGDTILRKGDVMVIAGTKKNLDRMDLFR
jgi:trk system potassium uptake protein TrkA